MFPSRNINRIQSWLHRLPHHRPHHSHRPQRFACTAPLTAHSNVCPNPLRPTALDALPTHSSTPSPPSLTAPTAHRLHSSAIVGSGLCHCPHLAAFGSGFQVSALTAPTALSASSTPTAFSASPSHCTWSPLVRVLKSFRGFQCVPKPPPPSLSSPVSPPRPPSALRPPPHRPQRFAQPLYVVTTITLTVPTAHRCHCPQLVALCSGRLEV